MKSKFFRATPGWGTGNIDSEINQWLHGKTVKVIDLKYATHTEQFTNCYGSKKDGTVYTATILYEDVP